MNPSKFEMYKKRGALRLEVISPKEKTVKEGIKVTEAGAILLTCAAAKEGQERAYNWEGKVVLALSPLEAEGIRGVNNTNKEAKFVHDPNMKSEKAGAVVKSLQVILGDNGGYSLNFSQKEGEKHSRASITLSPTEFAALKNVLFFAQGYVLGYL